MKYANKLMVVPFVNKLQDPEEKYLTDLDNEMSSILKNDKYSIEEKVKNYNKVLSKFISKNSTEDIKIDYGPKVEIIKTDDNPKTDDNFVQNIVNQLADKLSSKKEKKTSDKKRKQIKKESKNDSNDEIAKDLKNMLETSFPKKPKMNQSFVPNENDADDSDNFDEFKTPATERYRPVLAKPILKPAVNIIQKNLRSNTNPNDYNFKDKLNPMTGNGEIKSWITKKFF